ncbi:hypothetical protein FOA52_007247 [Chlamydomonas sp. UWO 241]|nr:hypothetical protein FOA52_007247 [Chlamydomonas sp. UWO 241]
MLHAPCIIGAAAAALGVRASGVACSSAGLLLGNITGAHEARAATLRQQAGASTSGRSGAAAPRLAAQRRLKHYPSEQRPVLWAIGGLPWSLRACGAATHTSPLQQRSTSSNCLAASATEPSPPPWPSESDTDADADENADAGGGSEGGGGGGWDPGHLLGLDGPAPSTAGAPAHAAAAAAGGGSERAAALAASGIGTISQQHAQRAARMKADVHAFWLRTLSALPPVQLMHALRVPPRFSPKPTRKAAAAARWEVLLDNVERLKRTVEWLAEEAGPLDAHKILAQVNNLLEVSVEQLDENIRGVQSALRLPSRAAVFKVLVRSPDMAVKTQSQVEETLSNLQDALHMLRPDARAALARRPHIAKFGRACLEAKVDGFAKAVGVDVRTCRAQLALRPYLLVVGVSRLEAQQDVVDDLVTRHPPWGDELASWPMAQRFVALSRPLARYARLRLLCDSGLAPYNSTPLSVLLAFTEREFQTLYNPMVAYSSKRGGRPRAPRAAEPEQWEAWDAGDGDGEGDGGDGMWPRGGHREGTTGGSRAPVSMRQLLRTRSLAVGGARGSDGGADYDAEVEAQLVQAGLVAPDCVAEYRRARDLIRGYDESAYFRQAYPQSPRVVRNRVPRARGRSGEASPWQPAGGEETSPAGGDEETPPQQPAGGTSPQRAGSSGSDSTRARWRPDLSDIGNCALHFYNGRNNEATLRTTAAAAYVGSAPLIRTCARLLRHLSCTGYRNPGDKGVLPFTLPAELGNELAVAKACVECEGVVQPGTEDLLKLVIYDFKSRRDNLVAGQQLDPDHEAALDYALQLGNAGDLSEAYMLPTAAAERGSALRAGLPDKVLAVDKVAITTFALENFGVSGYNVEALQDLPTECDREMIRNRIMAKVDTKIANDWKAFQKADNTAELKKRGRPYGREERGDGGGADGRR